MPFFIFLQKKSQSHKSQSINQQLIKQKGGKKQMKGSISSGAIYAGNLQGVSGTITTDGNGDGTVTLSFKQKMRKIPAIVIPSIQEADATGSLVVTTRTQSSVTLVVDGSSVISGVLDVAAIAFDDTYF